MIKFNYHNVQKSQNYNIQILKIQFLLKVIKLF